MGTESVQQILHATRKLCKEVSSIRFSPPVLAVYNPLEYAWKPYKRYVELFAATPKKALFLGMNPGPWGMAQTGIPFGEIATVRTWLGIEEKVGKPSQEIPSRPVDGFACKRSEVSGRRLWQLFKERFGSAEAFFQNYFVANYCPLIFFEQNGQNRTPDKLPADERERLFDVCDAYLNALADALAFQVLVGVGAFAQKRALEALKGRDILITRILHPSPSNPSANVNWSRKATEEMQKSGLWQS